MAYYEDKLLEEMRKTLGSRITGRLVKISRESSIPVSTLYEVFYERLYLKNKPVPENLKRIVEPAVEIAKKDRSGFFRGESSLNWEQLKRLEGAREILGEKEAINKTREGALLREPINADRLDELAHIIHMEGAAKARKTLKTLGRYRDFYKKYRPNLRTVHEHAQELPFLTEFEKALDSVGRHVRFPDPEELEFPGGHQISQPILSASETGESLGNMQIVVKPYGIVGIPPGALRELRHGPYIGFHDVAVARYKSLSPESKALQLPHLHKRYPVKVPSGAAGKLKALKYRRVLLLETSQTDMLREGVPRRVAEYYTQGKTEWINKSLPTIEEALRRANKQLPRRLRVHAIVIPELGTLFSYKKNAAEKMKGKYAQSLYTGEKLGRLGFRPGTAEVVAPHASTAVRGRFFVKLLR